MENGGKRKMNDGEYTYYEVQYFRDKEWVGANLDVFGCPKTFYSAWDPIGISQASINKKDAINGLAEIAENNPDDKFRLVMVKATKEISTIVTMGE